MSGAAPIPVQQAANALSDTVESNPDLFPKLTYTILLAYVRKEVANLIGTKADEVVLVTNASVGINTVLRNFVWKRDIIVAANTSFVSISKTAEYLGDIPPHPTISYFSINFPTTHSILFSSIRSYIQSLPQSEGKKRVAVIDSIISRPGVLLPWKEMVKICKEEGVYSAVDAVHSLGQEALYGERSIAVIYVPERNQHIIKATLPTSNAYISGTSHTKPNLLNNLSVRSFLRRGAVLIWTGTIDYIPALTIPDALKFRAWLGSEVKINKYCHDLAMRGGKRVADVLGTSVMDVDGEFTLNMKLPFPGSIPYPSEIVFAFCKGMLEGHKAFSPHFWCNGKWWTRVSVQVFNEIEDFEKLRKAWLSICKDGLEVVTKKQGLKNGQAK
ncbi:pyridoxal phosphate-dependent transferase [Cyathus striatus]|nr:pyridoxal phosphate-dependent transferase [Cyathus striatus]